MTRTPTSPRPTPRPTQRVTRRRRLGAWSRSEPAGGLLLGVATLLALVAANSALGPAYAGLRDTAFGPEALHLHLTAGEWAADGLLAVFFLVIGVELKRELVVGDLRHAATAVVPVAAAAGGVLVPVAVFAAVVLATGGGRPELQGWAVPAATDIAFAVAVLAVVARGLPAALRTFLLTLAVVDDLIAITIIAVGFSEGLAWVPLGVAVLGLAVFAVLARWGRGTWVVGALVVLGLVVWALVHASGVHATIAGVLLGLALPVPAAGRVEHAVAPWSACVAVPVFAFLAAGVDVGGLAGLGEVLLTPVALGVVVALVVGKPLGILAGTWLVSRLPRTRLQAGLAWPDLVGVALLGGIGFTVSLLVAELAYGSGTLLHDDAKVGVLVGSLLATVLAVVVLRVRSGRRAPETG